MIRMHFPIINKEFSYLDNAATTQKPSQVIDAIKNYYEEHNANIDRGLYELSERASILFANARKTVEHFVNAERVIFTKNATEALNLVAYGLMKNLRKGDNIVTTVLEHHSNYLPWKILSEEKKVEFRVAGLKNEKLDEETFLSLIDKKTKVVTITYVSNSIGVKNNLTKLIPLIKKKSNAKIVVDATQAVSHFRVDMRELQADYLAFSGHKMYGPTGIGVLACTVKSLEELPKLFYGGGMVNSVTEKGIEYATDIKAFEAGTPNIAGAIGLAAAIDFIKRTGFVTIEENDSQLVSYAINEMNKIKGLRILGTNQVSTIGFVIESIHPHDLATILDSEKVAIRAGHHCAQPLINSLGLSATARISFGIYNNKEDIDRLILGLKKAIEVFA